MTESIITSGEYVRKVGVDLGSGFVREGLELLTRLLMGLDISKQMGAGRHERG